jgi:hypothetical protein
MYVEKSFGLLFNLKKENKNNDSELKVYMRVTVNGNYGEISTKRKCHPRDWRLTENSQ